jgi:glucose-1-phosphate thymidylyltransferase
MDKPMSKRIDHPIGVIPAAGKGTRIAPLPGSKELFPIGFEDCDVNGELRRSPKVVSQYLIERMVHAGVERVFIILSEDKWDIIRYFRDGQHLGVNIAYLLVSEMIGMPYTINSAYPWLEEATVVFGMPDTIFTPKNAYTLLLEEHNSRNDDVTLGLFQTNEPWRFGMVEFDEQNRVLKLIDKPEKSELRYMWGNACWGPRFTKLLDKELQPILKNGRLEHEIVLGDFFQTAVNKGLNVHAVIYDRGEYIDIGSPEDLELAVRRFS